MAETKDNNYHEFDEYIRQGEPQKQEKAYLWRTAIGLQQVDGLTTSDFLLSKAKAHIEGDISLDEVQEQVRSYYQSKDKREPDDDAKEEADKVSTNIARILSSRTFSFNVNGYISVHRRIFEGVFKHAGVIRDYDITKKEWVLNGDTVSYLNWEDLRNALSYDIEQEKAFSYKGLSEDDIISHITKFVSGLWQIHAFCEGNTRTTAVFLIQYLRSIGFDVNNDLFALHSWYFRNALVRANYKNIKLGIDYSPIYLERFFRNLLLNDTWVLKNRYLHICPREEWKEQPKEKSVSDPTSTPQVPHKLLSDNRNIEKLIKYIGNGEVSIKEMLEGLGLKDRKSFMALYLTPAINEGLVIMLYPDSPRHPRQKYLLTANGLEMFKVL